MAYWFQGWSAAPLRYTRSATPGNSALAGNVGVSLGGTGGGAADAKGRKPPDEPEPPPQATSWLPSTPATEAPPRDLSQWRREVTGGADMSVGRGAAVAAGWFELGMI